MSEMTQADANKPCSCGSGKKFKRCCRDKDYAAREAAKVEEARKAAEYKAKWAAMSQEERDAIDAKVARKKHRDAERARRLLTLLIAPMSAVLHGGR